MKFCDETIVNNVRPARKNGLSLRQIEEKFHIPNSTLSKWVRDIPVKDKIFHNARLFEAKQKKTSLTALKKLIISKKLAKLFVSILYWCEGTKYEKAKLLWNQHN
jgi:transcriptional regulator with XRE-family HTH domain